MAQPLTGKSPGDDVVHDASQRPVAEVDPSEVDISLQPKPAQQSLENVTELRQLLFKMKVYPTAAEIARRDLSLKLLENTLLGKEGEEEAAASNRSSVSLVVVPVGSHELGVWTASSDVDCLCIGSISSETFFSLANQRLRKSASKGINILRRVKTKSGIVLQFEVLRIRMNLKYCPARVVAENWPRAMSLPPSSSEFSNLSTETLAKLRPVRDLYHLRDTIPDFPVFRMVYQLIRAWAKQRGIYSAKFGYLGGIHIAIMVSCVCKILSRDGQPPETPTIISTFFHHYAKFDWKNDMVFDPFFHQSLSYSRTTREPMVILGPHTPNLNTAATSTISSVKVITEELHRADKILSQPGATWSEFLAQCDLDGGAAEFLKTYKCYVKIDARFWGNTEDKGIQFVTWLESKCATLLGDINNRLPCLHTQFWPTRFSDRETDCACFVIGLDALGGRQALPNEFLVVLGELLEKFEGRIRGDEKHFDCNSCFMCASIVEEQSDLENLRLDHREWADYIIGDDLVDDEEEDQDDVDDNNSDVEVPRKSKAKSKASNEKAPVKKTYQGKFRSAEDVMNRLRWDPSLNSSDFVVGYEDRFKGVMERPLDQWKAEQTDEKFIPQHRIRYFKRKGDNTLVWDLDTRKDLIFGSGVSVAGPP